MDVSVLSGMRTALATPIGFTVNKAIRDGAVMPKRTSETAEEKTTCASGVNVP